MGMGMEIIAVCVLFHPEEDFFKNLESILKQVNRIIFVDNGSDLNFQKKMKARLVIDPERIYYIQEEKNVGLALAQNHGIQFSKKFNPDYLIFFDDDSSPNNNMVNLLTDYARTNPDVGIVAPDILHTSGGLQKYFVKEKYFWKRRTFLEKENVLKEVNTVISSGSVIPIKIIDELGGMREDYFIDYIDIEYSLRVRRAGFRISVLKDAKLTHSLGNRKTIEKFGISISPTHHNALRKYYMSRNRILTWRIYIFTMRIWFCIDFMNFLFDFSRMLLFEKDKIIKITSVLRGIRDGFRMEKNPKPNTF
jgi:GT2 family glycosyltransferase